MSILLPETTLSPEQFAALEAGVEDATFDLTLYRWMPSFRLAQTGSVSLHDFDAVVHDGVVYRLSGLGVFTMDGAPVGTYSAPVGAVSTASPSLVSDTNLYAFAITATGISRNCWNGVDWTGWANIVADATVAYIAAVDRNTVHFITYDTAHKRYRFQVAIFLDGSWIIVGSDIYWGFPITSFGAQRLGGKDVLAFTANLPGIPTSKTVGTQLVKSIVPAGGVCVITYQYNTWSDHIDIDHVDQWSAFRYRTNLRLSRIDNTLWITCYSSEGTLKNPVVGTRMYASKDGTHWSRGELLALPGDSSQGVVLLRAGDQLYALPRGAVYQASSTLLFGLSAASQSINVTKYAEVSVTRRDMQQISITLNNPDHWLDLTIIGMKQAMVAILKTGFLVDGVPVLQPIGFFEIDAYSPADGMPLSVITLTGRDPLAWLSTKTQSEQFKNWLPQGLGVDEYLDTDGTGYGGMTHTAPEDGSWMAFDGALRLTSNNERGIAYSTFLFDCWNGVVQTYFGLASPDNSEYAGVILRSQDKDNGNVFRHDQDSDTLKFENWVAGVPTVLWQSGVKSWGSIASHFLRVEFRYSRIRLYSSTATPGDNANVVWALEQSLLVDGHGTGPACESGYVGVLGRGFSDLDSWSNQPVPFPPGELPPDYPPFEPPVPGLGQPHASFNFILTGLNMTLTDHSFAPEGDPILFWSWEFSYGGISMVQNPTATVPEGNGWVKLTVTTQSGAESSTTMTYNAVSGWWYVTHDLRYSTGFLKGATEYGAVHVPGEGWRYPAGKGGVDVYLNFPQLTELRSMGFNGHSVSIYPSVPYDPEHPHFFHGYFKTFINNPFQNDWTDVYWSGWFPNIGAIYGYQNNIGSGWVRDVVQPVPYLLPILAFYLSIYGSADSYYDPATFTCYLDTIRYSGTGYNPFEELEQLEREQ